MTSCARDDYHIRIEGIHRELGIPETYRRQCGLAIQPEAGSLVNIEMDVFGRQPQLEAGTCRAWQRMKAAALVAGIELLVVSAYRSVEYQKAIFIRKLAAGQVLEDILKVNAAPGFSEHHSGRALDIGCQGFAHLSDDFENSPAYRWLSANAQSFGFSLSFPRNNRFGVLYEPWHWMYSPAAEKNK
ncbi:MAG: D-alanyl-D-alanine carboxypeptidase family protein [Pseudomonadales bacterium]|nr:D-alanyl-D-alanine carboxypeptidase family protein [Pseudomonadales bacterium]